MGPCYHFLVRIIAVSTLKAFLSRNAQHHIAQAFDVNQGRISEILNERRHIGSRDVALGVRSTARRTDT
jgi:hypothetical protein